MFGTTWPGVGHGFPSGQADKHIKECFELATQGKMPESEGWLGEVQELAQEQASEYGGGGGTATASTGGAPSEGLSSQAESTIKAANSAIESGRAPDAPAPLRFLSQFPATQWATQWAPLSEFHLVGLLSGPHSVAPTRCGSLNGSHSVCQPRRVHLSQGPLHQDRSRLHRRTKGFGVTIGRRFPDTVPKRHRGARARVLEGCGWPSSSRLLAQPGFAWARAQGGPFPRTFVQPVL